MLLRFFLIHFCNSSTFIQSILISDEYLKFGDLNMLEVMRGVMPKLSLSSKSWDDGVRKFASAKLERAIVINWATPN